MSTISPLVCVACGIAGGTSGAISGARQSLLLAAVGACIGVAIGIASFFGPVFPYVGWLILYEKRHHPDPMTQPPWLWASMFWPLMLLTLALALLVPWFVIGLLV